MLYELSQLLGGNLFGYISVRAGLAFFIAFIITLFIMPKYLAWAISKNANQPISKYVPAHEGKRRQVQYIGKLIRGFDPQPIIDFLIKNCILNCLSCKLHGFCKLEPGG